MSRTADRMGRKSSCRAARTLARARRRAQQRQFWLREAEESDADLPENLRRRWARRGLLGGGVS